MLRSFFVLTLHFKVRLLSSKWKSILIVVTFVTSLIAAGHGIAPVGLVLVFGESIWLPLVIPAWSAIVILTGGLFVRGRPYRLSLLAGTIIAVLAWVVALVMSDSIFSTTLFSLHFLAAGFFVLRGELTNSSAGEECL